MTDLSVFADEEFNPKAYINNLCAQKPHDDQTIDRYAPPRGDRAYSAPLKSFRPLEANPIITTF